MAIEFMRYLDKSMKYLHRQGAFLTVRDEAGNENVMTISWGNIGFEWGRPIFTILVRNSRFTSSIIENAKEFTVSIATNAGAREKLSIAGTRSGRNFDKFKDGKIERMPGKSVNVSVIKGADIYYECKIVYKHKIDPSVLAPEVQATSYIDGDYHNIYYGEIVECYLAGAK
ncbi:MAG: flavin reductase family protein [Clostridiaceae bacterium]